MTRNGQLIARTLAFAGAAAVHAGVIAALVSVRADRLDPGSPDPLPVTLVFDAASVPRHDAYTVATAMPLTLAMTVDVEREAKAVPVTIEIPEAYPAPPVAAPAAASERIRARLADTEADLSANPVPDYPRESRVRREEGTVYLRVLVTVNGDPAQVLIFRSSGHQRLDWAALFAVRRWKFVPARRDGVAVSDWVVVPVVFALQRQE